MRILIATGLYPPESGGPATYSKLLNERLPAHGFEVSVLPFRVVRHLPLVIRHIAYFFKVLRMARRSEVIYAQDTMSVGFPAFLVSLVLWKKFVVRVPGDHVWEQGRQRFGIKGELDEMERFSWRWNPYLILLRSLQFFVVRYANLIITPSDYMKKIVESWGARQERVKRIYSSVATPEPALVARPEGFFVVTIARPVPWKGLEGLRRVVAREKDWTLKIVNDLPHTEAMGWVKSADVFALNSTYEGLSHALVEAMMLGTPVVATIVGGNPELIESGVDGLLISPTNDEALYAALKDIEQNPEAARERAAHAAVRAKEFSIEKNLDTLRTLLKNL